MLKIVTTSNVIKKELERAKISFSDWLSIADEFSIEQVNTIQYALKKTMAWKSLAQFETAEKILHSVDVALIDGQLHKVNGIIRKGIWENGGLIKPTEMIIQVYKIDQKCYQELIDFLYPISARNKSQDAILACYKNQGLNFNSARLKHGYINDALNIALRGEPRRLQDKRVIKKEISTDLAIKTFKDELIAIDSINPNTEIFLSGVLAAALLVLSHNKKTIEFFTKLNNYQGITKGDRCDPIEALQRAIDLFKKKSSQEGKIQMELCSKTIRAVSAWKLGENDDAYWIKRLASPSLLQTIRSMKQLKKIHGIREL